MSSRYWDRYCPEEPALEHIKHYGVSKGCGKCGKINPRWAGTEQTPDQSGSQPQRRGPVDTQSSETPDAATPSPARDGVFRPQPASLRTLSSHASGHPPLQFYAAEHRSPKKRVTSSPHAGSRAVTYQPPSNGLREDSRPLKLPAKRVTLNVEAHLHSWELENKVDTYRKVTSWAAVKLTFDEDEFPGGKDVDFLTWVLSRTGHDDAKRKIDRYHSAFIIDGHDRNGQPSRKVDGKLYEEGLVPRLQALDSKYPSKTNTYTVKVAIVQYKNEEDMPPRFKHLRDIVLPDYTLGESSTSKALESVASSDRRKKGLGKLSRQRDGQSTSRHNAYTGDSRPSNANKTQHDTTLVPTLDSTPNTNNDDTISRPTVVAASSRSSFVKKAIESSSLTSTKNVINGMSSRVDDEKGTWDDAISISDDSPKRGALARPLFLGLSSSSSESDDSSKSTDLADDWDGYCSPTRAAKTEVTGPAASSDTSLTTASEGSGTLFKIEPTNSTANKAAEEDSKDFNSCLDDVETRHLGSGEPDTTSSPGGLHSPNAPGLEDGHSSHDVDAVPVQQRKRGPPRKDTVVERPGKLPQKRKRVARANLPASANRTTCSKPAKASTARHTSSNSSARPQTSPKDRRGKPKQAVDGPRTLRSQASLKRTTRAQQAQEQADVDMS